MAPRWRRWARPTRSAARWPGCARGFDGSTLVELVRPMHTEAPMLKRLLYSPFLVQLVVTRRCNLSCTYCNEFDDYSDAVPTEDLKRRMRQIKQLGAWAVEFTGGEPMMH